MKIALLLFATSVLIAACAQEPQPAPAASSSAAAIPKAQPAPADDRPVIVAFGDSLTAGHGLPPGSGYPEQLQQELDELKLQYKVINAGISGDTTSGGLVRLEAALRHQPSVVILELGANDGLRGLPVDQMRANLEELIVAFQDSGATVILAGMTLPRNYGEDYVRNFENVFVDLSRKYGLTLIPFFLEGVAGNPSLTLDDMLHPNREGYRIVMENVLRFLRPVLDES